jgi:hypothetical protein
MSTVSQISRELEWILDDYPRQMERQVGFVQRSTVKLDGSRFVRTLVLGWMHEAEASYSQLTAVANSLGPAVSQQAVEQRFSAASVTLFKTVLQEAGRYLLTSQCAVPDLLARFAGVYLQDGSVISLPDTFAERYPGTGGNSPQAGRSSLRIQVRWDISQGGIDGLWVQAGREAEGKGEAQNLALPKGSLFIGDDTYLSFPEMRERERQGGYWLAPARANTILFDEAGVRFDLVSFLQRRGQADVLDGRVQVGVKDRLACRLLAMRRPGQVPKLRRHYAQKHRKGVQHCRPGQKKSLKGQKSHTRQRAIKCSRARRRLGEWMVLLTNVPEDLANREELFVLMRVRWQEELLWKLWKQYAKLDTWRSEKSVRIETEFYAKLVGVLIEHWLTILGCWHDPKRSLRKAQQVCQWMSNGISLALRGRLALEVIIQDVIDAMQRGCRVDARRKKPSTYQYIARRSLNSS